MSKYHAVSSGMVTRQALPSITRQRGTTTGSANLMLYGAGKTTVSNNTTFIDSSANAFTITNNGSPVQSGYNPFNQPSSGAGTFNGSTDYLTAPASANFSLTGDFTVEGWVWIDSTVVSSRPDNAKTVSFFGGFGASSGTAIFEISGSTTVAGTGFAVYQDSPFLSFNTPVSVPLNTWNHVAFTRSGTTLYVFLNGTRYTLGTSSVTIISSSNPVGVGRNLNTSYFSYFKGYTSNLRVVKGTAVYTSNFTPPTSPLTAISGTSLLLLTNNYSIVNSTATNLPVTINGNTTISTAQFPTGMSSSIYFDGTGDFVTLPNNAAFDFGSGDFTIEMWIYFTATSGDLFSKRATTANYTPIIIYLTSSKIGYSGSTTGSTWDINGSFSTGTTTISTSTWAHIALVRQSGTFRSYINGVSDLVVSGVSAALMTNTTAVTIGAGGTAGSAPFQGYISNARVVKGTALYTANFTPPSAPLSTTVTVPAYVTNNIYGMNQIP